MPPASRVTDMHVCPSKRGPVRPKGCETVLIGGFPAARHGDHLVCGAGDDLISHGEPSVLIGGAMAARIGDPTAGGGKLVRGEPTVLIGHVSFGKCLKAAARDARATVRLGDPT